MDSAACLERRPLSLQIEMIRLFAFLVFLILLVLGGVFAWAEPLEMIPTSKRAITLKVQDDFVPQPGSVIELYVIVPDATQRSISLEGGIYANKETVVSTVEKILFTKARVLSADHMRIGWVTILVDHDQARQVELWRNEYPDRIQARFVLAPSR